MGLPTTVVIDNSDSSHTICLLKEPNGVDLRQAASLQRGEDVRVPSGAGFLDKDPALPVHRYEFEWICQTRAKRKEFERFFDQQLGRATGFWFPTWERDLRLADPYNGTHLLYIESNGYDALFALGSQYRRMLLLYGDKWKAFIAQEVFVDDPTPGVTKILHIERGGDLDIVFGVPPHPWTEEVGFFLLSLRWGRFDSDELSVEMLPEGGGLIRAPIIELPDEALP